MKYLKITNKGELDIRLVCLLGGTSKTGREDTIGKYGSGMKYTLAYLLRNNIDFHIYSGKRKCKIKTEIENIRGIDFEIICIDGERTSITTKMGPDFECWHTIREVYSNALDEGEATHEVVTKLTSEENKTSIYIQVTNEVQKVIDNWDKYFVHDLKPMCETQDFKIYPGGESLKIYKQGVLIHETKETKALFSYDVFNADINELREYRGSPSYAVVKCLCEANAKVIQYFLEHVREDVYEGKDTFDYDWYMSWRGKWVETIGSAKFITQKSIDEIRARGIQIDSADYIVVPKAVYKALTKQFPGTGGLYQVQKGQEFMEHYDPIVENRVKEGLAVLEAANYIFHPELTFKFGYFEDKNVQARVSMQDKVVCISNTFLNKPVFEICCILVEENEHFITGYQDNSREMQNYLFKNWVKLMLKEAEIEV